MRLGAGLTFVLVLLGGAESVMRAARLPPGYFARNPREDPLYIEHSSRGYTLKPGVHHQYVTPEVNVAINISSDGLRDTTVTFAKKADYRVLSIGDSFTMGLAVAVEDTWSEQLERLLNGRKPHRWASVVNSGVSGYGAHQIRLRLEELLPIVRPNLVVYGFTTETYTRMFHPTVLYGGTLVRSDALPGLRIVGTGLLYSPYQQAWMREIDYWLNQHLQLGAHILSHARRVYEALNPDAVPLDPLASLDATQIRRDMQPALEELAAMHRDVAAQHVPVVVLMINVQREDGTFRPQDTIYNGIVADECHREGLTCIDMLTELRRLASGRPIFRTPHDQHWTPAAHALAAQALLHAIGGIATPFR
jgi:hypothetical protein